jgi:hypothetical protein
MKKMKLLLVGLFMMGGTATMASAAIVKPVNITNPAPAHWCTIIYIANMPYQFCF